MAADLSVALRAERIAVLYRRIVLIVGAQLLGGCFGQVIVGGAESGGSEVLALLFGFLVLAGAFAAGVANAVFTYQLMSELGSSVAWLWALSIFVPCVSIVVLLVVSSRAQAWCKAHGVKVGLLGPTKESIEELKRQSSVGRIFE